MERFRTFNLEIDEEVLFNQELESLIQSPRSLVIHNDDFNTFDFVIDTLVEVCRHQPLQAEQCAYVIHHTGKCAVKTDLFKRLQPIWVELTQRGLTATIEDVPILR